MKNNCSLSLTAVFLITAILCFTPNVLVAQTAANPQKINQPTIPSSPDISFLNQTQISNLAQLNSKKIKKLKQKASATQETADLNAALKNYNVPVGAQAQLDNLNSKNLSWTANYNNIFVKTDSEKKQLLGVKPDDKILKLVGQQVAIQATKNSSVGSSNLLSKIVGYVKGVFDSIDPSNFLAQIKPLGINAACGTANNKIYLATDTGFGLDTFCTMGTVSGSAPSFPLPAGMVSWVCNGLYGGKGTVCSASRTADNYGDAVFPDTFDWRGAGGKNYVTSVKDQGQCGDCWAFGAVASLEGNIETYYNDPTISPDLSEQDLTSCDVNANGCSGANAYQIQDIFNNYYVNTGLTKDSCFPFTSGVTGQTGTCNKCGSWQSQIWKTDTSSQTVITVIDPNASASVDTSANDAAIKAALVNYGPVEVGMAVYNDLFSYTSGIYQHNSGYLAGYHAVTIVGYGSYDGINYWIVKNSWGKNWGEKGYFRIVMNDSAIDQWFAFAPGIPSYVSTNYTKKCTDNDGDGYCYWGTGLKPATGCPSSCAGKSVEDCDDFNSSLYQGCGALAQQTGILSVASSPAGANIYVQDITSGNWVLRGQAPLPFNLNTGARNIKISAQDFADYTTSVNIFANQETDLNARLLMAPKITSPLNDDVLRAGKVISITGNSGDMDSGTSYKIQWLNNNNPGANPSSQGITLTNNGAQKIVNGTLGQWDASFITQPGYYELWITSTIGGTNSVATVQTIYLDPTLAKGWPVRIPFYYGSIGGGFGVSQSGAPVAFTTAKYYAVIGNSSQNNNPAQAQITTNTNKNAQGIYQVNLNSPVSGNNSSVTTNYYFNSGFLEPVVADLNGNGKKETIVYRSYGYYPELEVFNPDGTLAWKKDFTDYSNSYDIINTYVPMPIVGDINNDGKNEIIVYVSNFNYPGVNSTLYALNGDGSVLWKNTNMITAGSPTMLIADLNGDGKKEIVVNGQNSQEPNMSVVDSNGNLISHWDLPRSNCGMSLAPSPAVGHFENNNKLQIVYTAPGPDCDWTTTSEDAVMYIFNEDGSVLSGWPIYLPGYGPSSPVVGDINKDGKDEIVVGTFYSFHNFPNNNYGGVYAIDRNGQILPGWPVEKGWNFESTPALGDVDGDGYLEISASRLGFETYLFRYDGSVMSGWPQTTGWQDYYGSIMGDVNGDGKTDILTTAGQGFYSYYGRINDGGVYAWNKDGTTITGFPKPTESDAQAPAALSDINNDGKTELIASSDSDDDLVNQKTKGRGSIYAWNTGSTYNQANMPWPMFMHDTMHTGCYDCSASIPVPPPVNNGGGGTISGGTVYYTFIASAGTGGSITPSGTFRVPAGSDQSFTITPNTGYVISSLVIDGSSVNPILQNGSSSETYAFHNVQTSQTISAVFVANGGGTTPGCSRDSDCSSGQHCANNVCVVNLAGIGANCNVDGDCISGYCNDAKVCAATGGGACRQDSECPGTFKCSIETYTCGGWGANCMGNGDCFNGECSSIDHTCGGLGTSRSSCKSPLSPAPTTNICGGNGAYCSDSTQCVSGYCATDNNGNSGVCADDLTMKHSQNFIASLSSAINKLVEGIKKIMGR